MSGNAVSHPFGERDVVQLRVTHPELGLPAGSIGWVIRAYDGNKMLEVEFCELDSKGVSHEEHYIVFRGDDIEIYLTLVGMTYASNQRSSDCPISLNPIWSKGAGNVIVGLTLYAFGI